MKFYGFQHSNIRNQILKNVRMLKIHIRSCPTMQGFILANLAKSAKQEKQQYDRHTAPRSFKACDPIWLSIPTAIGNYWDGRWRVTKLKNLVT